MSGDKKSANILNLRNPSSDNILRQNELFCLTLGDVDVSLDVKGMFRRLRIGQIVFTSPS